MNTKGGGMDATNGNGPADGSPGAVGADPLEAWANRQLAKLNRDEWDAACERIAAEARAAADANWRGLAFELVDAAEELATMARGLADPGARHRVDATAACMLRNAARNVERVVSRVRRADA